MEVQHPLRVVTPTLDGDVLTVLAQADASFTPGQVARLVPAASVEGIRKVLQRLAAQGIVDAEQVGRAYSYTLNREHLAAEHVVALANQRATLLHRIEALLSAWEPAPVYGAVFGSVARAQARTDSDVDIFLVRPDAAPEGRWDDQAQALAHTVSRWTGNDARLLEMTESATRGGAAAGDPVLQEIARDALTVAGSPTWLRRLVRTAGT